MKKNLRNEKLRDKGVIEEEKILRKCVNWGLWKEKWKKYVKIGKEIERKRGRIYIIKEMMEKGRKEDEEIVRNVERWI